MTARIEPGDGDPRHGTMNGYSNLKCRCVPCTGAWADYYAWLQRQERELAPNDPRHGTNNAYSYWHRRCRPCLDAHAARTAASYARRRAAKQLKKTGAVSALWPQDCGCDPDGGHYCRPPWLTVEEWGNPQGEPEDPE